MQATLDGGIAAGAAVGGAEVAGAAGDSWLGQAAKEAFVETFGNPAEGVQTLAKDVFGGGADWCA